MISANAEFTSGLAQWQNFQALAGAAAATLLGLLFVSASIRPELFTRDAHPELLSVGQKSMELLMLVVIIALMFLFPNISPSGMAMALVIMAIIALYTSRRQVGITQQLLHEWGIFFVARRILLPALGYMLILGISATIFNGTTTGLSMLGIIQIVFLFTATYNAWDLLKHVGKD